jgi:hypothetical protein
LGWVWGRLAGGEIDKSRLRAMFTINRFELGPCLNLMLELLAALIAAFGCLRRFRTGELVSSSSALTFVLGLVWRRELGNCRIWKEDGGGGEIRTLGGLSPSLVFKTSAFNRSATPPRRW